jgi:hypothetical protein
MPLIGKVDLTPYLHGVSSVSVGGEWGAEARELNYDWVLEIREQCLKAGISFNFWRTGQRFRKDGILHKVSPFRKKAVLKDLGVDNINVHVKSNIKKLLAEREIDIIPESDKEFLLAFDTSMGKLGYDFGAVIGGGSVENPLIINYVKFGTHGGTAARIYVSGGKVILRLLPKKLTPHFKYIESAPVYIREIFTAHHDNCVSCAAQCRTHKKYAVDGRFIQKCSPVRDLKPSAEYLLDYMELFLEFFPCGE